VLVALFLTVVVAACMAAAGKRYPVKFAGKVGIAVVAAFDAVLYYWLWRLMHG